jgi:murein DD-endopeptidase MepM/ murein hydrolase activator NlpD
MRRLLTFALLVIAAGFALALPATRSVALTPADARSQYREDQKRLADARYRIEQYKQREQGLNGEIAALDTRLAAIDTQLADMQTKIAGVQTDLATTKVKLAEKRAELELKRQELAAAKARLAWQETVFKDRLVQVYKAGGVSFIDVLVNARGFADLVERMKLAGELVGSDDAMVGALQAARDDVAAEEQATVADEAEIAAMATKLQKQSDRLVALQAAMTAKQAEALAARQNKSQTLAVVATNRQDWEAQQRQLMAESAQLAAIIKGDSGSSSGGKSTGSMVWPVNGPITSPFGWRTNPIWNTREFHTGIDIGVPEGTPIVAADGGTVISTSWWDGGGNVTVIQHANNIATVYMHQASFAVSTGAVVTRGQVIGYVGMTGATTGPHLHFEVRVNGNPVDPMGYLP